MRSVGMAPTSSAIKSNNPNRLAIESDDSAGARMARRNQKATLKKILEDFLANGTY